MKLYYRTLPLALACAVMLTAHADERRNLSHGAVPVSDADADRRAHNLVSQMTLDEKIQLVHGRRGGLGVGLVEGVKRLNIPDYNTIDSSGGVNAMNPRMIGESITIPTTLPSTLALAATWDLDLSYEYGDLIGREARALGYTEALGGGVNLTRDARNGRTFEYLGEDPVLAGEMIVPRIKGTQANQVIATLKHYVANDQETNRLEVNVTIDERTLREIHLLPFEIAVKSGEVHNVMCAYNYVNGEKSCENKYLLTDILKGEWGFKGKVQSDWGAIATTVGAALSGTDEEQPGSPDDHANNTFFNQKLKAAVTSGEVPIARLDDMVQRRLRTMIKVGVFDNPPPTARQNVDVAYGDAVALKIAERAAVLLKNTSAKKGDAAVLPLNPLMSGKIAVIGGNANAGVLSGGGSGSSYPRGGNAVTNCVGRPVKTPVPINNGDFCAYWNNSAPLAAIAAKAANATVTYYDGTDTRAAVEAASGADVVIMFATQWQGETRDLVSLSLPDPTSDPENQRYDQNALISAVAAKAKKMVVVLETGTAVVMPWIDNVHSVLEAWYPGSRGGDAIANVLFGSVNPSGKLPMTFPKREQDMPASIVHQVDKDGKTQIPYTEGRKLGYRWFDSQQIEPLFPFGHGLSYTTFSYSGLATAVDAQGTVTVSFQIKNTGKLAGREIAQIYAQLPAEADQPPKRLVAWQPVNLNAGESKKFSVKVPRERLANWDVSIKSWRVAQGGYTFLVGTSSRDANALRTKKSLNAAVLNAKK